jgi:hypothetical protein
VFVGHSHHGTEVCSSGVFQASAMKIPQSVRLVRMPRQALLVVSELVGNAVRHGQSGAHISIIADGPCLRLDVHDDSHAPARLCAHPTAARGFGLRLVDSVRSSHSCVRASALGAGVVS